ncbi:MAG: phage portal protein [Bacteroidales bacterium]|nr:phage portal protein [Bacteroidales bacterium]
MDERLSDALNHALSPDYVGGSSYIGEKGSLALAAVWGCVRILSTSIGILPLHLYRRSADGRKLENGHPAALLTQEPNEYWSRFDLMSWLMVNALIRGNGYARIIRDRRTFRPVSLQYLESDNVTPELVNGKLYYRIGSTGEVLESYEVLHIKGLGTDPVIGLSPIAVHRLNLSLTYKAQEYGERFFSKGGNTSSVFEHPGELKKDAYERLKADLDARMAGSNNSHKPLLLEGGLKYQRVNIPLEDAQFIQTRKYQTTEIASIYGVPPHMLGNLDKATYNNTELQGIEYVTYSLMPWLRKIELEFGRKLLFEEEKADLYFAFNVNGLMRGDAKSRSEFYKNMTLIGAMNANEVRELEEMPAYDGGEKYFVQLNMQPADAAAQNTEKDGKEDN